MTLFEKAILMHFIGDWLLQNEWMARHKTRLQHPAAWVHAFIHGVLLSLVLGLTGGVVLGMIHMLIDTRAPLLWWGRVFRQTHAGEVGTHVLVWGDQVLHLATIALWLAVSPLVGR